MDENIDFIDLNSMIKDITLGCLGKIIEKNYKYSNVKISIYKNDTISLYCQFEKPIIYSYQNLKNNSTLSNIEVVFNDKLVYQNKNGVKMILKDNYNIWLNEIYKIYNLYLEESLKQNDVNKELILQKQKYFNLNYNI